VAEVIGGDRHFPGREEGPGRGQRLLRRDGQKVTRDAHSNAIFYMPPEAKDVPRLMEQLITWMNQKDDLQVPIKAAVSHYQHLRIVAAAAIVQRDRATQRPPTAVLQY
jgi:hypothetical protein